MKEPITPSNIDDICRFMAELCLFWHHARKMHGKYFALVLKLGLEMPDFEIWLAFEFLHDFADARHLAGKMHGKLKFG